MYFFEIRKITLQVVTYQTDQISHEFASILGFLGEILPLFYTISIMITNISLILGGLIYLLDSREENGKNMIFRSLFILFLFIFIFKDSSILDNSLHNPYQEIEELGSFILRYLLYSFTTLSLIMFLANCGFYLLNPNHKTAKGIKKSVLCIFAAMLPLGFNFPTLPVWR